MDVGEHRRAYLGALQARDAAGARAAVDAALGAGVSVPDVYLEILAPALHAIGNDWAAGGIDIADEHYATAVTTTVLGALGPQMRTAPKDGRLAVVSGSPEERHALGVQMVADFLEGDGWEVLNLGASTPAHDLARLVDAEQADVVALSTSTPAGLPGAAEAVAALSALRPRPLLVLGGRLWSGEARREAEALGADLVLDGPRELVAHLRRRFPPLGKTSRVISVTRRRRRLIPVFAVLVVLAAIGGALNREDNGLPGDLPAVPTPPGAKTDRERTPLPDPFAYDPDRRKEFEARAAAGTSHVLYERSPGGAIATAQRVAAWRPQVEAAAKEAGVDPDRLEALVFLESAGRPDAIANDTEGAIGLTQILAETGQNLLGMQIDVAKSRHYSRRIRRELLRGHLGKVQELQRARAKVDQRFDPAQALAGTARYLKMAKDRFKREDMAFVAYHMGMGNLQDVLRAYGSEPGDEDLPYTQVYFDSSPIRHSAAYAKLASFGDDSSNYLWKLGAAERIMELSRHDRGKLAALQAAQTAKASAEEVLHPPGSTTRFTSPAALQDAWNEGQLVMFPRDERVTGLKADPRMGELAPKLGQKRSLYEGLRPEALATALYIGAEVRALSGQAPLTVTSTVREDEYQKRLIARNREATRGYSLHTTGWAFDIAREYRSKVHARAFQFVLDRLQVLDAIAWVREPDAIHVTAAPEGKALLPLLKRVQPAG